MTQKEQLWEQYEDAVFAILMDAVAEQEGKRGLQLMEELEHDPSAQVPEEVQKRAEKTIRKAFAAKNREPVKRFTFKVVQRIAVAVLVVVITTACAFAAFPEVRANVLNTIIRTFEDHTEFDFAAPETEKVTSSNYAMKVNWIPEGFQQVGKNETYSSISYTYEGPNGEHLYLSETTVDGGPMFVDTENAEVSQIDINGNDATLIVKDSDDWMSMVFAVPEKRVAIYLDTQPVMEKETFIKIAENLDIES